MKKLINILLLLLAINVYALSIEEENIATVMKTKIDLVTTLLQNKEISKENKSKQIFKTFDPVFDYPLMSRLTLGKQWKKLSHEQKKEFEELFTAKLKQSYIDKLDLYTDEKVIIKETKKVKKTRIKLFTELIGKEENFEIIYKFHKSKKNKDWMIYDVEIIGVSIMQTYRKQFAGILKTESFEVLLKKLKNKVN